MEFTEIVLLILALAYAVQSAFICEIHKELVKIKSELYRIKSRNNESFDFIAEKTDNKSEEPPKK